MFDMQLERHVQNSFEDQLSVRKTNCHVCNLGHQFTNLNMNITETYTCSTEFWEDGTCSSFLGHRAFPLLIHSPTAVSRVDRKCKAAVLINCIILKLSQIGKQEKKSYL